MQVWIQAARLKTLPSSFFPALAGILLAYREGFFNPLVALITLVCALSLQILTNFANDYFDFKKGVDTEERIGPTRVTAAQLVTPTQMQQAVFLLTAFCFLCGAYLVHIGGFPILLIGLLSVLFAIGYTAGPFPLSYLGLGDIFAFLFFGPISTFGSHYLQTSTLSWEPALVGVTFGCLSVCLLDTNNLRDYQQDLKNNKKTSVVRFGENFGKKLFAICLYSSLLLIPILIFFKILPIASLVVLSLTPLAWKYTQFCFQNSDKDIIPLLPKIAKFKILYGLLLSLSLLV